MIIGQYSIEKFASQIVSEEQLDGTLDIVFSQSPAEPFVKDNVGVARARVLYAYMFSGVRKVSEIGDFAFRVEYLHATHSEAQGARGCFFGNGQQALSLLWCGILVMEDGTELDVQEAWFPEKMIKVRQYEVVLATRFYSNCVFGKLDGFQHVCEVHCGVNLALCERSVVLGCPIGQEITDWRTFFITSVEITTHKRLIKLNFLRHGRLGENIVEIKTSGVASHLMLRRLKH